MRNFNKSLFSFLYFLLLFSASFAQTKITFNKIITDYQYNRYELAAEETELFIKQRKEISSDTLITLLEINAVSNFALAKKDKARSSFFKILKINENYSPDPKLISPKIIRFFEGVKKDYLTIKENFIKRKKEEEARKKIVLRQSDLIAQKKNIALGSTFSVLFPGVGHLYLGGANTKNVAITVASLIALGGSVYYYFDAEKLRKEYLAEVNEQLISEKYDKYNSSYKKRNAFIVSYFVVWTFAQLDFFWLSSEELFGSDTQFGFSVGKENSFQITFRKKL